MGHNGGGGTGKGRSSRGGGASDGWEMLGEGEEDE